MKLGGWTRLGLIISVLWFGAITYMTVSEYHSIEPENQMTFVHWVKGTVVDKTVYVDKNGKKKIEFKYSIAERFHEGLAVVSETANDDSFGFIDTEGNYKIKPGEIDFARKFTEGLAAKDWFLGNLETNKYEGRVHTRFPRRRGW